MDRLEDERINMKNGCKKLGKILRVLFWLYLILSLAVLFFWGICALLTPESSFFIEQYGSDAKVGFNVDGRGLSLLVTNTSFFMGEYSCKVLFGIVWIIALGYQALYATVLWCLASVFHRINLNGSPFTLFCGNLVRYIGFLLLGVFIYKNVVEAVIFFAFGPPTARLSWINNFELALIGGVVFCLSYIFRYGVVLQQQSDETL